jgi:hypothetical protein
MLTRDGESFFDAADCRRRRPVTKRSDDLNAKNFLLPTQKGGLDIIQPGSSIEGEASCSFLCRRFTLQICH